MGQLSQDRMFDIPNDHLVTGFIDYVMQSKLDNIVKSMYFETWKKSREMST